MHALRQHVRGWRALGLALALAIGAAGCGSDSKAEDLLGGAGSKEEAGVEGSSDSTTTTAAPGTPTTAAPDQGAGTKAASGSATTVPTTPPTTDPTAPLTRPGPKGQLKLEATLKETCVKPGGSQTISIVTEPGSGVGYDTMYADGKTGMMEGHYGGNFGGQVGKDGTWSNTWVVAPNAPKGKAQVNVLGSHLDWGTTQKTLFFTVADITGTCS